MNTDPALLSLSSMYSGGKSERRIYLCSVFFMSQVWNKAGLLVTLPYGIITSQHEYRSLQTSHLNEWKLEKDTKAAMCTASTLPTFSFLDIQANVWMSSRCPITKVFKQNLKDSALCLQAVPPNAVHIRRGGVIAKVKSPTKTTSIYLPSLLQICENVQIETVVEGLHHIHCPIFFSVPY